VFEEVVSLMAARGTIDAPVEIEELGTTLVNT
jgi:hypothetical protein